ncbi:hypothetical protein ACFLZC_02030 [Patescibacteria group bacterium]
MIPIALFVLGILATVLLGFTSLAGGEDDKKGLTSIPFLLLLASAVAKYLGM